MAEKTQPGAGGLDRRQRPASRAPWWIALFPRPHPESLAEIAAVLGVDDPCAISCDPSFQWVVEDPLSPGRPARETAGVQMTDGVFTPQGANEATDNSSSHSFLAWLGYLAGHTHIADCMRDDVFRAPPAQLMLDERATLTITGVDLLAMPTVSSPASTIRRSNTAHGKSPWTVARSCPSACSMASAYIWRATAVGRCWLSAWPAGCATSAARTTPVQTIDVRDPLVVNPAAGGPER